MDPAAPVPRSRGGDDDAELQQFCRSLPKLELHAHLSGSIRPRCLHEIWQQKKTTNSELELEDPELVMGRVEWNIQTFFPVFSNYIYKLCNDVESVRYSTKAVLQDFEQDGVIYLELRTTPREFKETGLTKEAYIETVLSTIEKYTQDPSTNLITTLILSIDRRDTPQNAWDVVDLAVRYKSRGVVGVDLCGDPLKGDVPSFSKAFARARESGLKITLHFAEAAQTSSDADLNVLLAFFPNRLGHVIHVGEDVKREIARRRLPLELCVSCNVHAKMITGSFEDHHFKDWWSQDAEKSHPIVLCTDDVGVFGSPCSNEYYVVAKHFGLSKHDLWLLSWRGTSAIFGTPEQQVHIRSKMRAWKDRTMYFK